jgi:xanthine dehydrogenase YagR molybdenum-binding subunit
VRHAGEYYVPIEHHNPMELYASTVVWEGEGKITIFDKTQGVQNVPRYVCGVVGMKPDDVRVMSAYMGGGFGSGLRPQYEVVLAVLAARALERSVRLALTRQQMYVLGYRPAMIQRIELGAGPGGMLEAISHEAITVTSQYEDFYRQETGWSGLLYTCANAKYVHKLARLDLPTSCDMRCPSGAIGVYALECAMDELAVALKLDPLVLRQRCYSDRDQNTNRPYSSKSLRACYHQGAEAFGWDKRSPEPRSMRDGNELVGWGMATGIWDAMQMPIAVRIVLSVIGHAEVSCATSDIGRHLHDHGASGSRHAGAADGKHPHQARRLDAAAIPHRRRIVDCGLGIEWDRLRLAKQMPNSPFADAGPDEVALADGKLVSKLDASRAVSIMDAMRHGAVDRIEQEKSTSFA